MLASTFRDTFEKEITGDNFTLAELLEISLESANKVARNALTRDPKAIRINFKLFANSFLVKSLLIRHQEVTMFLNVRIKTDPMSSLRFSRKS